MPEPPPPLIDIPPPPEQERLNDLKDRREVMEQKLAEAQANLKRMKADRRALLRKQIKRAESRLSKAERKRRNQRLIQLGLLAEARAKADPAQHARDLKDLDNRLTRNDLRALFGLAPLDKPSTAAPAAPASRDDPIPGWRPDKLPDGSWGARFAGNTSKLPDELVGRRIIVEPRNVTPWTATITAVVERSHERVVVTHSGKPR